MGPARSKGEGSSEAGVVTRIVTASETLTPAERKVADAVAADPQLVAFGTVAEVAKRAGASGASVVRLAARLGYDGFVELQDAVRGELADRLQPAAARIRDLPPGDVVARALATSVEAVEATLTGLDRAAFDDAVALLADPDRRVVVLAGDAGAGIARHAGDELRMMRPGVELISGTPVAVGQSIARLNPGDVVLALDLRRYDRWLLQAVEHAVSAGAELVALTDGMLSPLARGARALLVVEGEGIGPFDNYAGALALLGALVAGVADVLREDATADLDRVEKTWQSLGALTDR
ncbi:MurR/RpiR family transcriptional regulator [Aquihabitans daechungensis]|uniref:MurR/RpiR family transcriptional regulator n=1 Tax=Aquihabitans daechungensis TaxID=1052257 RepID=UPI003BA02135